MKRTSARFNILPKRRATKPKFAPLIAATPAQREFLKKYKKVEMRDDGLQIFRSCNCGHTCAWSPEEFPKELDTKPYICEQCALKYGRNKKKWNEY